MIDRSPRPFHRPMMPEMMMEEKTLKLAATCSASKPVFPVKTATQDDEDDMALKPPPPPQRSRAARKPVTPTKSPAPRAVNTRTTPSPPPVKSPSGQRKLLPSPTKAVSPAKASKGVPFVNGVVVVVGDSDITGSTSTEDTAAEVASPLHGK